MTAAQASLTAAQASLTVEQPSLTAAHAGPRGAEIRLQTQDRLIARGLLVTQRLDGVHVGRAPGGVEAEHHADPDRDQERQGRSLGRDDRRHPGGIK